MRFHFSCTRNPHTEREVYTMRTPRLRLLSAILAVAMFFTLLPVSALAEGGGSTGVSHVATRSLNTDNKDDQGLTLHPPCGSHRHGCQLRRQRPGWRHRYSGYRYKRRPTLYGHGHWSICVQPIPYDHQGFQRIHPGHSNQHWPLRFPLLQISCNGHLCRGFPIKEHWGQRFLWHNSSSPNIHRDPNTRFCRDDRH